MNVSKIKRQGEKTGRFVQFSQSVSPAPLSNYLLARGGDVSARAHTCVALGRCVAFGRPNISVWGSSGHWGLGRPGLGTRWCTEPDAQSRMPPALNPAPPLPVLHKYRLLAPGARGPLNCRKWRSISPTLHTHVVLSQRNSSQVKSSHLRPLPSNTAGLRSTFDRLPWLPVVSVYV